MPRRRRRRKWPWFLGVLMLGVLYVLVTLVQVEIAAHRDDATGPDSEPAQAIVVLGAAQYDGVPSPVLRARLEHALQLYQWGLAPVIVVTGGRQQGDRFTEATAGYDYLRAHGVPDSAIQKEVQGASTWESLQAAARFLREQGITKVILVSNGYHSKRLLAIADEVGLDARVSPTNQPMSTSARLRHDARETIAVSVGRITGFRRLERRTGH